MTLHQRWLDECLVDKGVMFLNCGTLAPTLRSAFQATYDAQLAWMTAGPGGSLEIRAARSYLNMMEEQDRCRRAVAEWLNTPPSNVALLGNATDGINAALQSIAWNPGDVIVTSDEEHEAIRWPLEQLQRRYHVKVETVTFPKTNDDHARFVEEFSHKLKPEVKLVALSHVSHKTGVRISLSHMEESLAMHPDVWLLIDGAHAAGTMTTLLNLRVDFYVFPGHKWLFGPVETGVLWVSERALHDASPLMSGSPMISLEGERYDAVSGAWRYEFGTRDWSKMVGLATAIRFRKQWAEADLVEHYGALGNSFAEGFEQPSSIRLSGVAPLYSFPTVNSNAIANQLWERHKILVKPQDGNIRISLPPWVDETHARELGRIIGGVATEMEWRSVAAR